MIETEETIQNQKMT